MSTFRIGRRFLRVFVFAGTAAVLVTGCKDSNDVAGVSNPAPTIHLDGAWSGEFRPAEPAFYYSEPVPAHANLQQTGTSVEGTITISGSPTVTIHATISGSRLTGTIEDTSGAGTMFGNFAAGQLSITLNPHNPSGAGTLGLRR